MILTATKANPQITQVGDANAASRSVMPPSRPVLPG